MHACLNKYKIFSGRCSRICWILAPGLSTLGCNRLGGTMTSVSYKKAGQCSLDEYVYFPTLADTYEAFGKHGKTYADNLGYSDRQHLFRRDNKYPLKEVPLIGQISQDFQGSHQGLWPHQEVKISLVKSKPAFYLLCNDPDVDAHLDIR